MVLGKNNISKNKNHQHEKGNVLFLALMAFVLFVALAYAVMHSFRTRDDSNREVDFRSAASMTQYSSAIRTGVTRMLLRDIPLQNLDFTIPDAQQNLSAEQAANMVFNTAGGGVTYRAIPDGIVNVLQQQASDFTARRNGNWYFTMIGINRVGTHQKELVAVLYDVKQQLCEDINYQITGNSTLPKLDVSSDAVLQGRINLGGPTIDGQPFLCISTRDAFLYYHVLAEQ